MADEQSFLEEICAHPDDDLRRLIYADWLEDQGDPRGEFIRVQCELATLKKTQKRFKELKEREQRLLFRYEHQWTDAIPYSLRKCIFRRGFIEECSVALSYFTRNWQKILQLTPLRDVTFTRVQDRLPLLADCPGLSRLRSIRLKQQQVDGGIEMLARSPHLQGVQSIRGRWTTAGLHGLAQSTASSELRHLIFDGELETPGVEALCQAEHLQLQTIDMSASIEADAAFCFCRARFAGSLQQLIINSVNTGDEHLTAFATCGTLPQLTVLRASTWQTSTGVRGPGLEAVAASPLLSQLRTLGLANHPLSYDAIVAVGESPFRKRGTRFFFGGNRMGYESGLTRAQVLDIQERFGSTFGDLMVPREDR